MLIDLSYTKTLNITPKLYDAPLRKDTLQLENCTHFLAVLSNRAACPHFRYYILKMELCMS